MTTYEKYLKWKSEQTSKSPSIKAFCEWLDNQNQPEEGRRDRYGLIKEAAHVDSVCPNCIYKAKSYLSNVCKHCRDTNSQLEYYYAKPD